MKFYLEMIDQNHLHIFSTYERINCIKCPSEVWFSSILTSLKMKKSVLIYEVLTLKEPLFDSSKRWQVDESWIWISPRAYGPILKFFPHTPSSYQAFKNYLSINK